VVNPQRRHLSHLHLSTNQPANIYLGERFLILLDYAPVVPLFGFAFSPFHTLSGAVGAAHNLQTNPCRNEQNSHKISSQGPHGAGSFDATFQDQSAASRLVDPFAQQMCPSHTFPPLTEPRFPAPHTVTRSRCPVCNESNQSIKPPQQRHPTYSGGERGRRLLGKKKKNRRGPD
jgi:hypothetical protein